MEDDSAHGVRFSENDQFMVFAINIYEYFVIHFSPYRSSEYCYITYPRQNFYVYSLSIILNNNNNITSPERHRFILVGEEMETQNVYLMYFHINKPDCNYELIINQTIISYGIHQEYIFLKVHPSQNFILLFADSFITSINVSNFNVIGSINMSASLPYVPFRTNAVDITDTYGILIGFHVIVNQKRLSMHQALLILFHPLKFVCFKDISNGFRQSTVRSLPYNRDNDMSVSLNPTGNIAIIGLPISNTVILLNINITKNCSSNEMLSIRRNDNVSLYYTGFGRSVSWIDDRTVAIVVLSVRNRPWSQSEIWIFNIDNSFENPLFVFPNSQQNIILPSLPLFLQIFSRSGNLFVFTDQHVVLVIPSQSPGFYSISNVFEMYHLAVFDSSPCIAGTYKNKSDFGPCIICPPQTKNAGTQPCTKCEPCLSNSYCPLGSIGDILLDTYPSYIQTFSYPDTSDMNNYDDILMQNIFTIGRSNRCIIISPLFWTIIVTILCCIVWFLMTLPKICSCPKVQSHRTIAKQFLKRIDIINEGEKWIGGLFSFAIILLFIFTFLFASKFLKLYPMEISGISDISCDNTVRNNLFESSLQLPLPQLDGNQWNIFEMLDNQSFTMIVDLLNTKVDCSDITIQQNRPGVGYLHLSKISCRLQSDNSVRSVSFLLPDHYTNVQINITGPYFIGGMRICLYGPGYINDVNTLQSFNMCQLFTTINETLSRTTTLDIVLIKVINVTKPLEVDSNTYYNGRWSPTFVEHSLTDELIYEQDGHYLRYIAERTIISITLSEQPFFLQNIQQPIIHKPELAFHTLLFSTLIIELFGVGILIFKLFIIPLSHALLHFYNHKKSNKTNKNNSLSPSTTVNSVIQQSLDINNTYL